jgi:hypothetical protein
MIKSVLTAGILFLSTSVFAQDKPEFIEENLPVQCGSLINVVSMAKKNYNEEAIVTWVDPRFGRYFLLSNKEGTSVSLLLAIDDIDDAVCVVSFGNQFMQAPPKPTL